MRCAASSPTGSKHKKGVAEGQMQRLVRRRGFGPELIGQAADGGVPRPLIGRREARPVHAPIVVEANHGPKTGAKTLS